MKQKLRKPGSEQKRSFREMAERSAQVANFLRAQGVRRGDRILLILGNELALWESMLGAFKLGAVVIPATALLTPDDLRDRLERGRVGHVIAGSAHTDKFAALTGDYTRISVGETKPGWVPFDASRDHPAAWTPDGGARQSGIAPRE